MKNEKPEKKQQPRMNNPHFSFPTATPTPYCVCAITEHFLPLTKNFVIKFTFFFKFKAFDFFKFLAATISVYQSLLIFMLC